MLPGEDHFWFVLEAERVEPGAMAAAAMMERRRESNKAWILKLILSIQNRGYVKLQLFCLFSHLGIWFCSFVRKMLNQSMVAWVGIQCWKEVEL